MSNHKITISPIESLSVPDVRTAEEIMEAAAKLAVREILIPQAVVAVVAQEASSAA